MIQVGGLLFERLGGWRGGEDDCGDLVDLGEIDVEGEWDWKKVEVEWRKGLDYVNYFGVLDGMNFLFDGGEDGVIGNFFIG